MKLHIYCRLDPTSLAARLPIRPTTATPIVATVINCDNNAYYSVATFVCIDDPIRPPNG